MAAGPNKLPPGMLKLMEMKDTAKIYTKFSLEKERSSERLGS